MSELHPRIAVSTLSTWNWSLEQAIALYKQLDVPAIGVEYKKAAADPEGSLAAIRKAGLSLSSVTADAFGADLLAPVDEQGSPALRALKPSLDFAAAGGGKPCYFVGGPTPPRTPTDELVDALIAAVPPVVAYAREIGVPLAIEHNNAALRDAGYINTLHDCIEFSEQTGIGICLEIQNCWIERHLPELFRRHLHRLTMVQVSDFMVGETTRLNRRVLGDGSIPLEFLLGELLAAGYAGAFEIEVLGPTVEAEGYESALRRSLNWLNERLVKWGA
ncbi:MAG TPA: sugar phosphate isomerase/epimerase family protein [Novosphingobium sp.]